MSITAHVDKIIKSTPGRYEEFWEQVPLLGHVIAGTLYYQRLRPFVRDINKALNQRSEAQVAARWQESGYNYSVALRVIEVNKDDIGWKKALFFPEDPFWLIYWAYLDAMDYPEALLNIQDEFALSFSDEESLRIENMSFGEVTELLENKGKASPSQK